MSMTMEENGQCWEKFFPLWEPWAPWEKSTSTGKGRSSRNNVICSHSISFLLRNSAGLHSPASPEAQWCHVIEFYVGRSYTHYLQAWPIRPTHSPPCSLSSSPHQTQRIQWRSVMPQSMEEPWIPECLQGAEHHNSLPALGNGMSENKPILC